MAILPAQDQLLTGEDRRSHTDKAYLQLEEMIITLQLKPGAVVTESALSQMLGIGRTPVREALQRLAREGLVTVLPRRGILVAEFDVRAQLKMLEVRREVERLMARKAAERATEREREHFVELAAGLREAARDNDDLHFMRLDKEFNRMVATAARNEFASKTMLLMAGLSRRFWFMHHQHVDDMPIAAEKHAQVAEAIGRSDADAAAAASDELLDYVQSITRAALNW